MKYYRKDEQVHAFELDGSQDFLITHEFKKMTDDEVDRHINPRKYLSAEEKILDDRKFMPRLSKRQLRLYLLDVGLLDEFEDGIKSISDSSERRKLQIEYNSPDNLVRISDVVDSIAKVLNWTDLELDSAWKKAVLL